MLVPLKQTQLVPTGTGKGQKRPLLVPRGKSYAHAGGLSLSRDKLYTHNGACPSSTCPNLSHKVGLQGRGHFQIFVTCRRASTRGPCYLRPREGRSHSHFFFVFTVGASWSVLISKGSCPFSSFFLGTVGWTRSRLGCEFLFFGVHSWTRGKLGCFDCQSPTAARPTVPKRKMRMGTTLPWAKGRTAKCHKCHKSATSSRLFSDVPQISMFRSYVLLSFGSDKSIILILATYTFMG